MSTRRLVWAGVALAVLSLGMPWRSLAATPGYVTTGYYTAGYCDADGYCFSGSYQPGSYVPGLPGGTYAGLASDVRFAIAAAVVLALWGGLHLGRARALRWAAYAGVAGVLLYLDYGLMGGMLALLAACACFWLASRRTPLTDPSEADAGRR